MRHVFKIKTIANLFLVLIFAGACYLPLVKTIVSPTAAISETEKRKLADVPDLEPNTESIKSFSDRFETYFKDHFGFRDQFVFLNSYVSVKWLGVSPLSSVILGKDGWLFWNKNYLSYDFRGAKPMTPVELEQWKNSFEDKQEWMASQGIAYIAGIAPEKQTIYPEFLPDHLQKHKGVSRLTQLENYLQQNSSIRLINWTTPLIAEKKKHQIYYKTDTHWNFRGGLAAYQAMMPYISVLFPGMMAKPGSFFQERIIVDHEGGDMAVSMGLQKVFREDQPIVQPRFLCGKRWEYDLPLAVRGSYAMGCRTEQLKAVVFRDSYFNFILPFLSEHFGEIIYIWDQYNHELASQLIKKIKPDMVIEEILERFLVYEVLDQEGLKTIEDALAPERFNRSQRTFAAFDQKHGFPFSPAQDLIVVSGNYDLMVKSTGDDPQLLLPDCIPVSARSLYIKIEITSPSHTEFQIFYRTGNELKYSETKSVSKTLKQGYNELYLQIPARDYHGPLRIDPGKTPGDYVLHSMEIRGVDFNYQQNG
ncbi:MAG: hypothetical protein WA151_00830 [Desulfatirhabdiaceae bacterium]